MTYFKYILIFLLFNQCSKPKTDFEKVIELQEEHILEQVEKYYNLKPITVTDKVSSRSAGGIHDFYSEGDYWWPNPEHPDSAYVRKDGLTNPDNFTAHRKAMVRLSRISGVLASAYLLTKDEKYIKDLIPHIKAWFVDEATKMNPNLLYAQAIKGRVTGRGIGIIDTIHLIEVAKAIQVIEEAKFMSDTDMNKVQGWFADYLNWITTHPYGKKERDNGNNHSTCWAMQVAAFSELTNNKEQLKYCRTFFKEVLLPEQMAEDGRFPKELSRTKPFGYSIFNLDAFFGLAQIASTDEDNLFEFATEKGKSLKLGMKFLYPFLKNKSQWPFKKDVLYWEYWPTKHASVLFGALYFNNTDYLQLWKELPQLPENQEILRNMPIRNPLLWIRK